MTSNRLLVIEKLVFAIPPNMVEAGDGEITIDDALIALLAYRHSSDAVLMNQGGDFLHSIVELPDGCNPEDPMAFTKERLLEWLAESKHVVAGVAHTLVYDEDLKSYRNAYKADDLKIFAERKAQYLESLKNGELSQEDLEHPKDIESIPIVVGGVGGRLEKPESIIIPPDEPSDPTAAEGSEDIG